MAYKARYSYCITCDTIVSDKILTDNKFQRGDLIADIDLFRRIRISFVKFLKLDLLFRRD